MALTRVDGVEKAVVSYEAGMGTVEYDPNLTSPDEFIEELVEMTGYGAEVTDLPGLPLSSEDVQSMDGIAPDHDHNDPDHVHPETEGVETSR